MASTITTVSKIAAIAALVLALECCGASALSPTPAPENAATTPSPAGSTCFTALTNMSDCLTFVVDGSNLTKPDKGCCPELAGLVDSNPICLCELLGNADSIGIKINLNKAIKLPSVCGVTTPPVSTCSAVGVPVSLPPSISDGSPSLAPGGSVTNSPAGAPNPSSSDHADASPSQHKNGASGIPGSARTIFCLFIVCVSIVF